MRVYLAARFSRQEEMRGYADLLEQDGHQVVSRWVRQAEGRLREDVLAERDVEDVWGCEVLVLFAENPQVVTGGGRHFETGLAYGLGKGIVVVGGPENIFHRLPSIAWAFDFETAREILSWAK